jgi:thiamine biosynthesis lipoprotein
LRLIPPFLALALPVSLATSAPKTARSSAAGVWVEREAYLMGTRLRARVRAVDGASGAAAIEDAFAAVDRLEGLLSSWRENSELGLLNAAEPGSLVRVSSELVDLLEEVRGWADRSEGAFEPAVGPLIDAWDLRGRGRIPSESELARALSQSGAGAFELKVREGGVVRRKSAGWMTAGGFGKGAALRAASDALEDRGIEAGVLDFGGQLVVLGIRKEGWEVGVAHPSRRAEVAATLRLRDVSVATSAASERYVEVEGERFGHILDPRTGRPVPAWGSVTVVADDPMVADLVSTTLFVLGPVGGREWVERHPGIAVLFLCENDDRVAASWNEAMEPWLAGGAVLKASQSGGLGRRAWATGT